MMFGIIGFRLMRRNTLNIRRASCCSSKWRKPPPGRAAGYRSQAKAEHSTKRRLETLSNLSREAAVKGFHHALQARESGAMTSEELVSNSRRAGLSSALAANSCDVSRPGINGENQTAAISSWRTSFRRDQTETCSGDFSQTLTRDGTLHTMNTDRGIFVSKSTYFVEHGG